MCRATTRSGFSTRALRQCLPDIGLRNSKLSAIADGLTPALKAARTAFNLPVVNEPALSPAASRRRCGFASTTSFSFAGLGGRRPRRSASVVTAASSASISTSSNRFSAPAKSVGKKCLSRVRWATKRRAHQKSFATSAIAQRPVRVASIEACDAASVLDRCDRHVGRNRSGNAPISSPQQVMI